MMQLLITLWIYSCLFIKPAEVDDCFLISDKIACSVSISFSLFVLQCNHKCLQSGLIIIKNATEMDSSSSREFLTYFFTPRNYSEVTASVNDSELIISNSSIYYPYCIKKCDHGNHSVSEQNQLMDKFIITKMKIFNFTDLRMIFNEKGYPDLTSLTVQHFLSDKWHTDHYLFPKKEIYFPSSLKHLNITNNKFTLLNKDIFWNLRDLESLNLSKNMLRGLRISQFPLMKKLTILNLSYNFILNLEENIFLNLTELCYLDLSFNLIKEIPEKLFANLRNLEELNISNNLLKELKYEKLFKNIPHMKKIDLSMNKMISYPKNLFEYLLELTYIDLSYNHIKTCHRFRNQENLEFLNLSHNRITSLSEYFFRDIALLKVIIISSNRLKKFNLHKLQYLENLKIFDASKNFIATVDSNGNNSINVRQIYFHDNRLEFIPPLWQMLPHLEILDLVSNRIKSISVPSCFPNMEYNVKINLAFNLISLYDILPWINQKQQLKNIQQTNECLGNEIPKIFFNLSYNPLNLMNESSLHIFIDTQKFRCSSIKEVRSVSIDSFQKEAFSCPFQRNCAEKCTCGIFLEDKSIFVNCTGAGLDKVVQRPPPGVNVLYINQNFLRNLTSLNTAEWSNLTHLFADNNSLVTLDEWIVPPNLKHLSIRNNKLKSLSHNLYDFISSQKTFELEFGNNSRNCNCDSEELKNFLLNHQKYVIDINDISCDYENEKGYMVSSPLYSLSSSILCGTSSNIIQKIIIILFLSLITLILGMILLYYKHRYLILSYLYVHCRRAICFKFSEESDDKLYDAFVAYSSYDRQIVMEILQELEEKEPFFKLCIHERDWLPGRYITDNIYISVQNSKRTILVISEQFISSPWFKLELHAAMSKISEEEMNSIIVVMANKSISYEDMDEEFHHVVSKRSYLVYGERWFWEKLRYAMPHKISDGINLKVVT